MDKTRLSPCKTCGKEISTNLIRMVGGFASNLGCPHCGEAEPHITEETLKRRREQHRELARQQRLELQKQIEKDNFRQKWGTDYPFIAVCVVVIFFLVWAFLVIVEG